MIKKGEFAFFCTVLTITILVGCSTKQSNATNYSKTTEVQTSNDKKERVITDAYGYKVTLPEKVDSVAAGGALNQVVLMLGGGDRITATAEAVQNSFFSTVYPRIKEVPAAYVSTGTGTLNVETLLQQKPQVVFATSDTDQRDVMEAAGVAVVGVKLVDSEDIKNTILTVGKILGEESEKKAKEFVKYYDDNINLAKEKTKDADKIKVFVASGDTKGAINTIPDEDINTLYINAAGGVNIVSDFIKAKPASGIVTVDFEFLLNNQPDVIIANSKATYDYIIDKSNGSQWQELNAVKNNKVYLNPKGVYLWSVRSAEGALQPLWLGKTLHPELFKDVDIKETVREFYETNYYYDLSDEEIDGILNQKYK